MKILYIGDVMGDVGVQIVEKLLPTLRKKHKPDLVIAQAENVTDGHGISPNDFARLKKAGVDFCTGGNHILKEESIFPMLSDPEQPIIRPANFTNVAGLGFKYFKTTKGKVLIVSLLGQIVGKDGALETENPLSCIDQILKNKEQTVATIVNFHGDYSSEKVIIGHYLDGQVTAVIGDHWHIPTADARVLPKGTAHITDVGMVGTLNSSLGVTLNSVIPRWRDEKQTRNVLATDKPWQFNAVLVTSKDDGLAESIEQIQEVIYT